MDFVWYADCTAEYCTPFTLWLSLMVVYLMMAIEHDIALRGAIRAAQGSLVHKRKKKKKTPFTLDPFYFWKETLHLDRWLWVPPAIHVSFQNESLFLMNYLVLEFLGSGFDV